MSAPRIAMPGPRILRATAPAATREAVSRAEARPPPVEPLLDVRFGERDLRRHAIDDDADRRPVALAPGGEAEQRAQSVAGHDCRLDDRNIRGVGAFHADDVIPAIDVMHLAGDPGRQIAQQINPGAADILDRDVALQWRIELVPFEDVAEIADAAGRDGVDRAGRDRVDPDILAAEIDSEIANAGFERRLGHPHDVAMLPD